eukprot:1359957-Prymnesium_polylepis.1
MGKQAAFVHRLFQTAIRKAYLAATNAQPGSTATDDDYVQRSEFRLLLVYLIRYAELFIMFSLLDDSGDKRMDLAEFKDA